MGRWTAQPIYIWFRDKYGTGEENCLPYNPDHFYVHITGNNEEIDMISGPVTIQKKPKLVQYDAISSFFAHPDIYRYMRSKDGYDWTPAKWENFFKNAMDNKKVLELTVTGKNWVDEVTVEDFTYGPKAGVEKDSQFTLQIKQYRRPYIKKESIVIERNYPSTDTGNKNIGNNIDKKDSIGADLYLIGIAFKGYTSNTLTDVIVHPEQPQYNAGFEYMPVKIIDKRKVTNPKIMLAEVSLKIIEETYKNAYKGGTYSSQGFASYENVATAIQTLQGKYTYLLNDKNTLLTALWNYYKCVNGVNVSQANTHFTKNQLQNFFKCMLNPSDLRKITEMRKSGSINDKNDLQIVAIARNDLIYPEARKLNGNYANLDAPEEEVCQVKFLEDVNYSGIYDPIQNKWSDTVFLKANDGNYWVYMDKSDISRLEKDNGGRPFKLTISKK